MKDQSLSPRQREVLNFIEQRLRERGVAPTLYEIRDHLGHSTHGAAMNIVQRLIELGRLERSPTATRRRLRLTASAKAERAA